jgi:hypothetical protein
MRIIVKMTHSEEKARDFFRFHLLKRTPSRYVYFGLAGITFVGAVVFLVLSRFYYAFFLSFVALMLLIIRKVVVNTTVNGILKKLSLGEYNFSVRFEDEKVVYETASSRKEYSYGNIVGVAETKRYVYLYVSPNAALILSKVNIKPEERTELVDFLKGKCRYRRYSYK